MIFFSTLFCLIPIPFSTPPFLFLHPFHIVPFPPADNFELFLNN